MAIITFRYSIFTVQRSSRMNHPNLRSSRAKKARYARRLKGTPFQTLKFGAITTGLVSVLLCVADYPQFAYLLGAVAAIQAVLVFWYANDLSQLPANLKTNKLEDIMAADALALLREPVTPKSAFLRLQENWQANFLFNHLYFLHPEACLELLDGSEQAMEDVWQKARELQISSRADSLNAGTILTAILLSNKSIIEYAVSQKVTTADILEVHEWLRQLERYMHAPKPYFGGIGRDWATGFTPTLDNFSTNISKSIERGGSHYQFLSESDVHDTIIHSLSDGAGGVALIGEAGSGKTSLVHGLAHRLLEGRDPGLQYYQVISLNASMILSAQSEHLERLVLTLFGEAVSAGNIIIFLDDAELFFGEGLGAFDMSQVLLPVLRNRRVKLVAAFTPSDFQRIKGRHESLMNALAPVVVTPPEQKAVMKILEDTALTVEASSGMLVTYDAVREAYRLSDQYIQERAFPGKAIDLLEQAVPFAENRVLTAASLQTALEKTRGIHAGIVQVSETDVLLNLEDKIHERMINQTKAVSVVSAALRRSRAGVSSPNRPIGSFLFLGPTGVGKTELARSLAAVYFGDERQMIRLDMSEYQQETDVSRILESGSSGAESLIMAIRKQPFAVVLLDEIEKAHPNILNLLLQLLDEGQLTDSAGKAASFKNAIIIATSNAGAADISARVAAGESLDGLERPLIDKLIASGQFKPELINRFDEVVLFRPLNMEELTQVASLMLSGVNNTIANQNISVELTPEALEALVKAGYDPQFGARPMRRIIQKTVEDAVAIKILSKQVSAGEVILLSLEDLHLED